jgi:hypothetical protein
MVSLGVQLVIWVYSIEKAANAHDHEEDREGVCMGFWSIRCGRGCVEGLQQVVEVACGDWLVPLSEWIRVTSATLEKGTNIHEEN